MKGVWSLSKSEPLCLCYGQQPPLLSSVSAGQGRSGEITTPLDNKYIQMYICP